MTIDESKTVLTTHREHWERLLSEGICDEHEGKETISALTIALASLEAWELVQQEIISERNHRRDRGHHEQSTGLSKVIDIIDRHLKEVEE